MQDGDLAHDREAGVERWHRLVDVLQHLAVREHLERGEGGRPLVRPVRDALVRRSMNLCRCGEVKDRTKRRDHQCRARNMERAVCLLYLTKLLHKLRAMFVAEAPSRTAPIGSRALPIYGRQIICIDCQFTPLFLLHTPPATTYPLRVDVPGNVGSRKGRPHGADGPEIVQRGDVRFVQLHHRVLLRQLDHLHARLPDVGVEERCVLRHLALELAGQVAGHAPQRDRRGVRLCALRVRAPGTGNGGWRNKRKKDKWLSNNARDGRLGWQ